MTPKDRIITIWGIKEINFMIASKQEMGPVSGVLVLTKFYPLKIIMDGMCNSSPTRIFD